MRRIWLKITLHFPAREWEMQQTKNAMKEWMITIGKQSQNCNLIDCFVDENTKLAARIKVEWNILVDGKQCLAA